MPSDVAAEVDELLARIAATPEDLAARKRLALLYLGTDQYVPVIALTCSLRSPKHPNVGDRFQVWIYGTQRKIHVRNLPRVWTQKATSWIGGLAAAGAAVGFVLGKLLQWVL